MKLELEFIDARERLPKRAGHYSVIVQNREATEISESYYFGGAEWSPEILYWRERKVELPAKPEKVSADLDEIMNGWCNNPYFKHTEQTQQQQPDPYSDPVFKTAWEIGKLSPRLQFQTCLKLAQDRLEEYYEVKKQGEG